MPETFERTVSTSESSRERDGRNALSHKGFQRGELGENLGLVFPMLGLRIQWGDPCGFDSRPSHSAEPESD